MTEEGNDTREKRSQMEEKVETVCAEVEFVVFEVVGTTMG